MLRGETDEQTNYRNIEHSPQPSGSENRFIVDAGSDLQRYVNGPMRRLVQLIGGCGFRPKPIEPVTIGVTIVGAESICRHE
jgi:hypothetical protein